MDKPDYDLFVIGAGSGGVRAARIAGGYGAKVAIAEEYRIGGTCVIRGCVPKKLLVYASRFADDFEDARGFGWSVEEPKFDWATLIAAKDKEIARLEGLYRTGLASRQGRDHRGAGDRRRTEHRPARQVRARASPRARSSSPRAARRWWPSPSPASSM